MKIYCYLCCIFMSFFFGICTLSHGKRDTNYNDCLTWHDDQDWLQLICRVSDVLSPVIFLHNETQTEVHCKIQKYERGCTPKSKTLSINEYNNTVTLVLKEQKDGRHLDGKWYCKQDNITHSTEVSSSEGIIADSSIHLRGTVVNKSRNLIVECSSCRIPKGPYAEININGKIEGSLRQANDGCFYNYITPCSESDVCQCTETKNAFSLRLQLPISNTSANISCHMHFNDTLRGKKFFVTVSHVFEGKDFRETGNDITILTHRYPRSSLVSTVRTTSIQSATVESTNTTKTIETTPNVKTPLSKETLVIVIVSAIAFVIMLVLICLLWFKSYKIQKKLVYFYTVNARSSGVVQNVKQTHVSSMYRTIAKTDIKKKEDEQLVKFNTDDIFRIDSFRSCQSCKRFSTKDIGCWFCFDCLLLFCYDSPSEVEHVLHITLPISNVPSSINPVLFFTCHDKYCHEYLCENHDILFCTKCKDDHVKCKTKKINSISSETIRFNYETVLLELKTFKEKLNLFHRYLHERDDDFNWKLQAAWKLRDKETTQYRKEIRIMISKIGTNENLLKLIETHADNSHLFIVIQKLKYELVLIKKKIGVYQKSLYPLDRSTGVDKRKESKSEGTSLIVSEELINSNLLSVEKHRVSACKSEDITVEVMPYDEIELY